MCRPAVGEHEIHEVLDVLPVDTEGGKFGADAYHAAVRREIDEELVIESIIGTRFTGQAIAETQVGSGSEVFPAVIPKVTGSAHISGFHQFVLDGEDPFPEGFQLKT